MNFRLQTAKLMTCNFLLIVTVSETCITKSKRVTVFRITIHYFVILNISQEEQVTDAQPLYFTMHMTRENNYTYTTFSVDRVFINNTLLKFKILSVGKRAR
jgi:hypothetical protein